MDNKYSKVPPNPQEINTKTKKAITNCCLFNDQIRTEPYANNRFRSCKVFEPAWSAANSFLAVTAVARGH